MIYTLFLLTVISDPVLMPGAAFVCSSNMSAYSGLSYGFDTCTLFDDTEVWSFFFFFTADIDAYLLSTSRLEAVHLSDSEIQKL